jgi:hypothetical protein
MAEEIVRRRSPEVSDGQHNTFRPDELNADLAAASLARDLIAKLPTPAIDTRKFTIIHGLMKSLNHVEEDKVKGIKGNLTYIDTSLLVELMDRVSEKSVNVDGRYFQNLFAYLMKPKYIIQGMPQTSTEEKKPGLLSRMIGMVTGKSASQEQSNP